MHPARKGRGAAAFDGKPEELFPKIGDVLRPYFGEGDRVEMAKADLKLLEAAEKVTKPFYKNKQHSLSKNNRGYFPAGNNLYFYV